MRFKLAQIAKAIDQPCQITISLIQIGAKGEVHPFETG